MTDKDTTDENMTEHDHAPQSKPDQRTADPTDSDSDETLSPEQPDAATTVGGGDTGAVADTGESPESAGVEPKEAELLGSTTDTTVSSNIADALAPAAEPVANPVEKHGASEVAQVPADDATDDSCAPVPPATVAQAPVTAGERIAKVMSRAGVASRREAERMIVESRVTVNGRVIDSPALDVTPSDRIAVDGRQVEAAQETRLWLYYKPVGIVTTDSDELGRQTIQDALPRDLPRVMTVGRLDLNSEGLLLLTNDGTLKRMLELPSTGWQRRYRVRVNGTPNDLTLAPLKRGIIIDGEEFAPMEVTIDSSRGANSWLTVGIREGRNREIRRAMAFVNLTVNRLIRIGYGPFKLADMEKNEVREVKRRLLREQLGGLMPGAPEAASRAPAEAPRKPRAPRRDEEVRPGSARPARAFGADRGGPRGDDAKPRARSEDGGARPQRAPRPGSDARPDRPARKPWAGAGADRPERGARPAGDGRADRPARKPWAGAGADRPERGPRATGDARPDRPVRQPWAGAGAERPDRGPRPAGGARTDRSAGKPWATDAGPKTGFQRRVGSDAAPADRPVRGPRPSGDARSDRPARKPWDGGASRQADGKPEYQKRAPRTEGAADRAVRTPRAGGQPGSDRPAQKSWGGDSRRPASERPPYQKDGARSDGDSARGPRPAGGSARDDRSGRKPWDAGGGPKSGGKGGYQGRAEGRPGSAQQRPAEGGEPKVFTSRPRPAGNAADAQRGPDRGKTAWGQGGGRPSGGKTAGPGKPRTPPSGGKPTRGPGGKPSRDR